MTGRPVTYGVTDEFLVHFGLESADALPGIEELRASGLLEALPASGGIPMPGESLDAAPEDPLGDDDDGREFLEPLILEAEEKAGAADDEAPGDDGDDDSDDDDDDDEDSDDEDSDDDDDDDSEDDEDFDDDDDDSEDDEDSEDDDDDDFDDEDEDDDEEDDDGTPSRNNG